MMCTLQTIISHLSGGSLFFTAQFPALCSSFLGDTIKQKRQSHPDVVEGVCGVARVVEEAVSSVVTLREGHTELGVNVFHELSSIMHCLEPRREEKS